MSDKASLDSSAAALLERALIWDNVWPVDLQGRERFGNDWSQLERFAKSGVGVLGITLAGDDHNVTQAIELIAWARRHVLAQPERYVLVETVDDVIRAHAEHKLGVTFQFEGTRCFERNLDLIDLYYKLGIRQTIPAFNQANSVGAGCAEHNDGGLTNFGRRFVKALQTTGMLVDLSHVGYRTSLEALEIATRPMAFTHSNAYAVHPSFRNIRDDQVKACAATGGLVGISGASEYIGDPRCGTEALFRHLDHFVQLVGADHVGIGLDVVFDAEAISLWIRQRPDEWPMATDPNWPGFRYVMPEQLAPLTAQMLHHGYGDDAVLKILGGNYVRVCRAAWGMP